MLLPWAEECPLFFSHFTPATRNLFHYDLSSNLPRSSTTDKTPMKRSRSSFELDGVDAKLPDPELEDNIEGVGHNQDSGDKTCPHCHRTFTQKSSMRRHVSNVHLGLQRASGEQPRRFECERCNSSFSRKESLTRHVSDQHVKAIRFGCSQCSYSTSRRHNLERHEYNKHNEQRFRCLQCGKGYDIEDDLYAHIRSKHIEGTNLECSDCGSRYKGIRGLTQHQENTCHYRNK